MCYQDQYDDNEYYTVRSLKSRPKDISTTAYHDCLGGWRGRMKLDIEALSQVYVGSGDLETDKEGVYQTFSRSGESLVIPGTSIKGVIRSYAEALSPSCEGEKRCDPGKTQRLCLCCVIFGTLGFQGRISFCDTQPLDLPHEVLARYSMKVRWKGKDKGGRRFYYQNKPDQVRAGDERAEERVETAPAKTRFISDLFFENLATEEIGLLLLAMGCAPACPFNLKLGGGKNRRLGNISIHLPDHIRMAPSDAYTSFRAAEDVKTLTDWGVEAVSAYLRSLEKEDLDVVLENVKAFQTDAAPASGVLTYPNDGAEGELKYELGQSVIKKR